MDIPSVILFTVHLLQNLINKQWIGALPEDKTEVRRFLNEYLLSHHKKLPGYIRNKLVKVIVDIGRVDWPHFYPNFLSNIVEVSRHKLSNGIIIRWKMILAFVNAPYAIILQKICEDNNNFFVVAWVILIEHIIRQLSCFQGQWPHCTVVQVLFKSFFFKGFTLQSLINK